MSEIMNAIMTTENEEELGRAIYLALKRTAEKINSLDATYGKYALRKVDAVSANSDLATLVQTGEDLDLIASKVADGDPLAHGDDDPLAHGLDGFYL